MIKVTNLTKHFTSSDNNVSFSLTHLTFDIKAGEVFGIMGPSGAGKSTLLRLLNGQMKPDEGTIELLGKQTNRLSTHELHLLHRQTAFVFQSFNLLSNKRVIDNVLLPLKGTAYDKDLMKQKSLSLLTFVGLADKAMSYPATLSGGEAQRVAIARALISDPKIIFFDEPTSALDQKLAFEVVKLIKRIKDELSITIVIVSHQKEIVKYLCDRALWIENGEMVKLDTVKTINEDAFSPNEHQWGDLYDK